jgi:bifunctional DNA-binding transcriptional regulator/antitoxin component of YhaV-PrlF toxin-antitoxin module
MSEAEGLSSTSRGRGRARGSHKPRGGFGKYLRARGRGHARGGRPAEWRERLVLEDEQLIELDPDSEEVKALERKYTRRTLESNSDRYEEKEELDENGEYPRGSERITRGCLC